MREDFPQWHLQPSAYVCVGAAVAARPVDGCGIFKLHPVRLDDFTSTPLTPAVCRRRSNQHTPHRNHNHLHKLSSSPPSRSSVAISTRSVRIDAFAARPNHAAPGNGKTPNASSSPGDATRPHHLPTDPRVYLRSFEVLSFLGEGQRFDAWQHSICSFQYEWAWKFCAAGAGGDVKLRPACRVAPTRRDLTLELPQTFRSHAIHIGTTMGAKLPSVQGSQRLGVMVLTSSPTA
ncbi:unnamed protein product [Pleuronectes platessa]|uniref:Uncharacterized protein n=1 Tax=Pleuronectes platessa TaxID=8262 RepID=A0A9N7UJ61_PLEPL|nr:unnamed protein product [Pleuronectes platessa]